MAKGVRVQMRSRGARALLRGSEVQGDIQARVTRVGEACGDGYVADTDVGRNRVHGMVKTHTPEAMRDNQAHNTLLKQLDRGR